MSSKSFPPPPLTHGTDLEIQLRRAWEEFSQEVFSHPDLKDASVDLQTAFALWPRFFFTRRVLLENRWVELRDWFAIQQHLPQLLQDRPLTLWMSPDAQSASTASQSSFVARLLHMLSVPKGGRILEIGSGCGWVAAILGTMSSEEGKVYGVEIIKELVEDSARSIKEWGIRNVFVEQGDGRLGLPEYAPFSRILVSAACDEIPPSLITQLENGGKILAPINMKSEESQEISLFRKVGERLELEDSVYGRFVPLISVQ